MICSYSPLRAALTLVLLVATLLSATVLTASGQNAAPEPTVQTVIPVDPACTTTPRPRDELFVQMTAAIASTATPSTPTGPLTVVEESIGSYDFDVTVDGVLWIEDSELVPGVGSTDPLPDGVIRTFQQLNACDGQLEIPFRYALYTDDGREHRFWWDRLVLERDRLYIEQYEPVDDGEVDAPAGVFVYSHLEMSDGRVAVVAVFPRALEHTSGLLLNLTVFEEIDGAWLVDWEQYAVVSTSYSGTPVASPEATS